MNDPNVMDLRAIERHMAMTGEGITMDFRVGDRGEIGTARVADLSSKGLSFYLDTLEAKRLGVTNDSPLSITIKMRHGQISYEISGVVRSMMKIMSSSDLRVGVETYFQGLNDRKMDHIFPGCKIPSQTPLLGFAYKEHYFRERAAIRVTSISLSHITFEAEDPAFLVFPGMRFSLYLSLNGADRIQCSVQSFLGASEGRVGLEARIDVFTKASKRAVAGFLALQAKISPAELRANGLNLKEISESLRVRAIKSKDEYGQVLELRRSAYEKAGKLQTGSPAQDTAHPLDSSSMILVALHGNRIVGSVTITMPSSDDVVLESEAYFETGYPESVPDKKNLVEISRLCIDSDYQGTDALLRLFSHVCRVGLTSGRSHIVTSADDKLWPLYKKMGFYKTGLSYSHPRLANREHHLILYSRERFVKGIGTGPLIWNKIYRRMYCHLRHHGIIQEREVIRVRIYKLIGYCLAPIEDAVERLFVFLQRKRKKQNAR